MDHVRREENGRFNGDHAVIAFQIGSDGQLHHLQTLDGNKDLLGFAGGNRMAISPDGTMIYASGTNSNHLAALHRDPKSGKLTVSQVLEGLKDNADMKGVNGLVVSPDGEHLYTSWEYAKSVSGFQRAKMK